MKCPKCKGSMAYEEYVNGMYTYPVNGKTVDWATREFEGQCYGHAIRCDDCGFEQPSDMLQKILDRSMK